MPLDPAARFHRYHRQMLLPGIGRAGQERLGASHGLIVGCGALGTVIADTLARAGVGTLTIVDRDVVEITNLQRQVLFDESDVRDGTPKAIAAKATLERVNSQITIHALVEDFNHTNARAIARGADVILDGLDNFQTRYLLNDLSVEMAIPYCYGGAVGTTGMACAFIPRSDDHDSTTGPCLRCIFPEAPPAGTTPTCDTAGVLAPAVAHVAQHQVTQALKLLTGNVDAVDRALLSFDLWHNEWRRLDVSQARHPDCPCCGRRQFEHLAGRAGSSALSLCGRGAVQINPRLGVGGEAARNGRPQIDLQQLALRLAAHGAFRVNAFLLRGTLTHERGDNNQPIELTVFADGRAIITGTGRTELARSIHDRYVGT